MYLNTMYLNTVFKYNVFKYCPALTAQKVLCTKKKLPVASQKKILRDEM